MREIVIVAVVVVVAVAVFVFDVAAVLARVLIVDQEQVNSGGFLPLCFLRFLRFKSVSECGRGGPC